MDAQTLVSLFTLESLLSLQGAAVAVLLVPNVLGYLIGDRFTPYRKWVSFGLSMLLAYLVAALAPGGEWAKWVLAFFNGFLIFASAVGINEGISSRTVSIQREGGARFFTRWL